MRVCFWLRSVVLTAACAVFFSSWALAESGQPLLTLLYTGNSEGNYRECPVCGDSARGGLDRRSTVISSIRKEMGGRVLTIAGGFEFVPFRAAPAGVEVARGLAEAYRYLKYDLGLLTPGEWAWLQDAEAGSGEAWLPPAAKPATRMFLVNGVRVGVVVLPFSADVYGVPEEQVIQSVGLAVAAVRPQVDVLVGLGAWGARGDQALLADSRADFDVLLASGPGVGSGVRLLREGRTLYVRPEFKGWSVVRLDLLALPLSGGAGWSEGSNFSWRTIGLDASVPADAKVSAILAWI